MKKNEHLIKEVYPGSIAEEMGIEPGDVLLRINKQEIGDVFDYRYYIKDDYIEVLIRKADGEEWLLEIDKDYDDDLGIEFDNGLMSDYRSCSNKCIFCFIDPRVCVRPCILKMTIPDCHFCKETISRLPICRRKM